MTHALVHDLADSGHAAPRHADVLNELVGVVQELSLARDLDAVTAVVRRAARELTGADGATFVLRDGDQCYYAEENAISPLWKGRRFPMGLCISGWVMLNRRSTVIEDIFTDPRIPIEAYRPTFVRSLVMVPIRTREPIGAIGNYWARPYRPSPDQVAILQALADSTAVALENVQIYGELEQRVRDRTAALQEANEQLRHEIVERRRAEEEVRQLSLTDELTGLYNRRGFMLLGEREFRRSRRENQSSVMLFADLDGLKTVNDRDGHEAGDRLIAAAAAALKASFRATDIIARLGGDEFAVLATGRREEAGLLRDRLAEAMSAINRAQAMSLAMSIGIVESASGDERAFDVLLAEADQAMYREKAGRRGARSQNAIGSPT